MTYSASAGTRMSLVTHLTTASGASRSDRDDAEFVDRQPHHAGDMIDRMRAEHEAHRRGLSRRGVGQVDRLQVARRDEIDAGLVLGAQHQPAQADIGEAGLRIDDVVDGGRDIGPAVGAVLEMHRQPGHIGVLAGQHHRLARRLGARDLEHLRLVAKPPLHLFQQLGRLDAERRRDAGSGRPSHCRPVPPSRARPSGTAPPCGCPPSPRIAEAEGEQQQRHQRDLRDREQRSRSADRRRCGPGGTSPSAGRPRCPGWSRGRSRRTRDRA